MRRDDPVREMLQKEVRKKAKRDLDDWLDAINMSERGQHDEEIVGKWWPETFNWGVEVDDGAGVIALFADENDAARFRLDYINRKMNP